MSPTTAAREWLEAKAQRDAAQRRVDASAKVLKEYFRARPKVRRFRGVEYASSSYTALDTDKARELLGPRVAEAEVTRTRETLSPVAA